MLQNITSIVGRTHWLIVWDAKDRHHALNHRELELHPALFRPFGKGHRG